MDLSWNPWTMTLDKLDGFRKAWVLLRGRYFCLCSLTNSQEKSIASCNIVRKKWVVSGFQTLKSVPGEKTNRNLYIWWHRSRFKSSEPKSCSFSWKTSWSVTTHRQFVYTMINDHQVFHCISIFLSYQDLWTLEKQKNKDQQSKVTQLFEKRYHASFTDSEMAAPPTERVHPIGSPKMFMLPSTL